MIGDFNCVRDSSEIVNCIYKDVDYVVFIEFIMTNELSDVKLVNSEA